MEDGLFQLIQKTKEKAELSQVLNCNQRSEHFGLALTEEEAKELMICRDETLKRYRRVEFGNGILEPLIDAFCDSQYLNQDNYLSTLSKLQDIFYEFKNETQDKMTDDELLTFMREQFESICYGDLEYLETTCLSIFAEKVRNGYRGYEQSGGSNEYEEFDEVTRWDSEIYQQVVKELFWG